MQKNTQKNHIILGPNRPYKLTLPGLVSKGCDPHVRSRYNFHGRFIICIPRGRASKIVAAQCFLARILSAFVEPAVMILFCAEF